MLFRIKYAKTAEGKYLSHLDMSRAWERTMRRARVPLAFSQGFHPHPKIAFGSALAVGVTSDGEYIDVEITEDIDVAVMRDMLERNVPPAMKVLEIQEQDKRSTALMTIIDRACYQLKIKLTEALDQEGLEKYLAHFLSQEHILIMRTKKKNGRKVKAEKDIKPGIFEIKGAIDGEYTHLELTVQTGSEGNVRPEEIVAGLVAVGFPADPETITIHRTGLYIQSGNCMITPLEV